MRAVLIIDPDLGFVFWLGRLLAGAGCQALPAKGFSEASALLDELHMRIDLLVVSSLLTGSAEFAETLRRSHPNLKVLLVLDEKERSPGQFQNADAILRKPVQPDRIADALWLRIVEHVLIRHFVA